MSAGEVKSPAPAAGIGMLERSVESDLEQGEVVIRIRVPSRPPFFNVASFIGCFLLYLTPGEPSNFFVMSVQQSM